MVTKVFEKTRVWHCEGESRLVELLFELSDQGQPERMFRVKDVLTGAEITAFEDELS